MEDDNRMPLGDQEVDYLLARGGLGGEARERVLSNVQRAVEAEGADRRRSVRRRRLLTSAAVTVAAAAVVVLSVRSLDTDGELRRKGGSPATPSLDVACLRGTRLACPRDALLAFTVQGPHGDAFFTAFAEPAGGGERIWYLANEPSAAAADGRSRALEKGARVGAEHHPGRYRVRLLLSPHHLSRAVATSERMPADVIATAEVDLVIAP